MHLLIFMTWNQGAMPLRYCFSNPLNLRGSTFLSKGSFKLEFTKLIANSVYEPYVRLVMILLLYIIGLRSYILDPWRNILKC